MFHLLLCGVDHKTWPYLGFSYMCMHLNPEMKDISLKEMIATTGRKINMGS